MSSAREFFTVDLRGLRAALAARAAERGITQADVLRAALASDLKVDDEPFELISDNTAAARPPPRRLAKLSVRLISRSAERMRQDARAAGLSRGAYLSGLIDGAPPLVPSSERTEAIAALKVSCAELAVLSRDVRNLNRLLRGGSVDAAGMYRGRFDTMDDDVRAHLQRAATVLAMLVPPRASNDRPSGESLPPRSKR